MVVSRITMSCATDKTASAAHFERVTEPVEAPPRSVVVVCVLTSYSERYGVKTRIPLDRCPEARSRVHLAAVAEVEADRLHHPERGAGGEHVDRRHPAGVL